MNPRIYNFSSTNKDGKQTTSKDRQAAYRRAKKLGLTMAEYRKHQEAEFKRLYAFLYIKDYGKAAVAFKRAMQEAHPDHGGDPQQASRIIVAWDDYKRRNGCPRADPLYCRRYRRPSRPNVVEPVRENHARRNVLSGAIHLWRGIKGERKRNRKCRSRSNIRSPSRRTARKARSPT
jgi:hypothetical protein